MNIDINELVTRVGRGVLVFCEREKRGDESIYSRWFSDYSTRVTFEASDGLSVVGRNVEYIRQTRPSLPAYGLLDRDFSPDDEIKAKREGGFQGPIFRLDRYTIENYLLEPAGWLEVVKALHICERMPEGWGNEDEIATHISSFYVNAMPAAAHNWTIWEMRRRFRGEQGYEDLDYFGGIRALDNTDPEARLSAWAEKFGQVEIARTLFAERRDHLEELSESTPDKLACYVSGKFVLDQIQEHIPVPTKWRPPREDLLYRYLDKTQKTPPDDVLAIIERMLELAEKAEPQ
ncbi:MAG: hypothetical protein JXR96_01905 [Deltaproteobacteria bacterium]|nr:hypothetical protein [Deltaproteobacteria bacterium]